MFLQPDWAGHIESIVDNCSNFHLIGCMTNRLGLRHQLHGSEVSDNPNISDHIEIAKQLKLRYGNQVVASEGTIAGLLMLFPKSLWAMGRFPDGLKVGNAFIDYHFCQSAIKNGFKIGIAKGLYIFHLYRMGKNIKDISHLV